MSGSSSLSKETLHKLILKSFEGRDRAYAPYSKFHVGASLLFDNDVIITGCNVENASYGAGVCAERTAMTKAITEGLNKPLAVVVTSLLPTPSVSPCGICRQFLREFASLNTPIYMVADGYPRDSGVPKVLEGGEGYDDLIKMMTLEELLPMSFGPEHLA